MSFRQARKDAGKKVEETAAALGVSRQTVFYWERGTYKPEADKIIALAEFYGCSTDKLLREDE